MRKLLGTTRFWIFIILLLLLIASITVYQLGQVKQEHCLANIYQDGQLIHTIDLSQVLDTETFLITAKNGGSNRIAISPGKISVQDATCPDHLCVQQGWISDGVYPIVCLPNKLVIRIEECNNDNNAPDVMTQ